MRLGLSYEDDNSAPKTNLTLILLVSLLFIFGGASKAYAVCSSSSNYSVITPEYTWESALKTGWHCA